jgi:DNA invertase Pin-like site-specific DNA recombinase
MTATKSPPQAYSYVRFSHPSQAAGDGFRRQAEAAAAWCDRNGVRLDTSTTLHDLGKSAFRGSNRTNPDRHALAAFLKLVEAGKVPRGSYLVIENLDRLSREHIQPALLLVLGLLQAGIRIVQLKPSELVFDDKSDTLPVMMMLVELSRGHSESAMKSSRIGGAWDTNRKRARGQADGHRLITSRLPSWLRPVYADKGGKRPVCVGAELIPEKAAVVRRIFALAAQGHGHAVTVRKLMAQGVKAFGACDLVEVRGPDGSTRLERRAKAGGPLGSGRWNRAYVAQILRDRRAVGEFQPRLRDGSPAGEPIPNYFPAVVSEAEWLLARAGAAERRHRPGRGGTRINLFAGLVADAVTGSAYYAATRPGRNHYDHRVLQPVAFAEGHGPCSSFPLRTFERAILSLLPQLNPAEVLDNDEQDPAPALEAELTNVKERLEKIKAQLVTGGDVATLAEAARDLEAKAKDLQEQLDQAKQGAARPVAAAWAELGEATGDEAADLPVPGGILPSIVFPPELARCFQGGRRAILPALDNAEDPEGFRLRLRSVLRRIVKRIDLLIATDGADRLAVVQLQLVGDKRLAAARAELNLLEHKRAWAIHIHHKPPRANANGRRPGRWWAWWATPHDLTTARGRAKALEALRELRVQGGDTFREGAGAVSKEIP